VAHADPSTKEQKEAAEAERSRLLAAYETELRSASVGGTTSGVVDKKRVEHIWAEIAKLKRAGVKVPPVVEVRDPALPAEDPAVEAETKPKTRRRARKASKARKPAAKVAAGKVAPGPIHDHEKVADGASA
jgi:hypothetical protein